MAERTIALIVQQPGNCKLLRSGDRWLITEGEVKASGGAKLCGHGVCSLFPKLQRILQTAAPDACLGESSLICDSPGCGAAFRLEIEQPQEQPAGAVISRRPKRATAVSRKAAPFVLRVPGVAHELIKAGKTTRYEDGQVILEQGIVNQHLYVVAEGTVEVAKRGDGHDEIVLATLARGDCFGETSILTGDVASAAVRSRGKSSILSIHKDQLEVLLQKEPQLSRELARMLAERLSAANALLQSELNRGIIGTLSMISLVDLVQALSQSRSTGTLVLSRQGEQGRLGFSGGNLCAAHAGELLGDEAFYKTICWPDAAWCFEGDAPAAEDPGKISSDTMFLLMEGMRRLDEGQAQASPAG
jgi:CRP-like cAMP-binding protein